MRNLVLAAAAALSMTTPAPATTLNLFGWTLEFPTYLSNQLKSFEVMADGSADVCTPLACIALFPNTELQMLSPPVMFEAGHRLALVYAMPYASFADVAGMVAEAQEEGQIVLFDWYLDGICLRRLEGPELCTLTTNDIVA